MSSRLAGRKVMVVGASKGIGRAIAVGAAKEGASVAAVARSAALLDGVAAECPGGAHPLVADVRDADRCAAVVAEAVEVLGGLDTVVYATGMTIFTELSAATVDDWRQVFETNVFGAAAITAAALPHLEAGEGRAIYLSSEAKWGNPAWRGLGLYVASKAALEKSVEMWNVEHPTVRFTSVVVGSTMGTEFIGPGGEAAVAPYLEDWAAAGNVGAMPLQPSDHAEAIIAVLTSDAQIDVIWVRPRGSGRRVVMG